MNAVVPLSLAALMALAASQSDHGILESTFSPREVPLTADPAADAWRDAPRVLASVDRSGTAVPGRPTEIRSLWTKEHLSLLFTCPYQDLHLKPDPTTGEETPKLWNWDVAEAFIGSDFARIGRYREFQVSPQGEWVDLAIDRDDPKGQEGMRWNSGYQVKARIDAQARIWYGEMRIPFRALDVAEPRDGTELRLGLFRLGGSDPKARLAWVWRPSGQSTFHVPQAFGTLRLTAPRAAR